jgi:hypothetical protein
LCSARALGRSTSTSSPASSSKAKANGSGKTEKDKEGEELTPLTDAQKEILPAAQEDVIQMMASRKIEVGSGSGDASSSLDVPGMGKRQGRRSGRTSRMGRMEVRFGASIER